MCSQNDDPTTYDDLVVVVRSTCDRILWSRGEPRRCGQRVGLQTWTDTGGYTHSACQYHVLEMRNRHPQAVPA